MKHRTRWAFAVAFLAVVVPLTVEARADVLVDRIVAVVGPRAITLSDLRERLVPLQKMVDARTRSTGDRAAAYARLKQEALNDMIDEALIAEAAKSANVSVERDEIDRAMASVAEQRKVSQAQILAEAESNGMSQAAYRAAIGRQILELKLLRRRFPSLTSAKDPAAALGRARASWLEELREATFVDVRL
jgi:peptidyl-prolyl cis-trans isomerase SurA